MSADRPAAFRRQGLVITAAMLLPALPVTLADDVVHNAHQPLVPLPLVGAVAYGAFLVGLGAGFAAVGWVLIEVGYLDRLSLFLAAITWPWVVVVGGVLVVMLVAGPNWSPHPVSVAFNRLTGDGQAIAYGLPYCLGGTAAAGLSRVADRYRPDPVTAGR